MPSSKSSPTPWMGAIRIGPVLVFCALLQACGDKPPPATTVTNGSAVLGNAGQAEPRTLIPPPPLPDSIDAQLVPTGTTRALALWVQDGGIMAADYTAERGWAPAQALERIHGSASDPQLASDGGRYAMAVWHHTVGKIHSLRFSRYEAGTGWSVPDVMPGALPRAGGQASAPELRMDAAGHAYARWPSGFDPNEMQSARFVAGYGWSRAVSEPMAAALRQDPPGGG